MINEITGVMIRFDSGAINEISPKESQLKIDRKRIAASVTDTETRSL